MARKRGSDEGRRIVEEFERSGMARGAFCERTKIPTTTLDYWRRKRAKEVKPRMVEVIVERQDPPSGFTVVLAKGRRIEVPATFHETAMASLIRIVESA